MIKKITIKEFDSFVKENPLCVVDFYADWCGPCKMLGQELQALSDEKGLMVGKVDIDDEINMDLAMKYNIQAIPFIVIFKDGKEYKTSLGYKNKEELLGMLA